MNIRKLKTLLWVFCLAAFVGAGYTFYDIWSGKKELRYKAREATIFHDLIQSKVGEVETRNDGPVYYSPERYQGLWLARLDGSLPPVIELAEAGEGGKPVEQAFVLPPISSVLNLGMIVYADKPLDRFVALTYTDGQPGMAVQGKARRLHVSEGEALKAPYDEAPYFGKLLSIGRQSVTFQWGEHEEQVTPGLGSDGTQKPIADWTFDEVVDPTAALDGVPEESIELEPGKWVIGQNDLQLIEDDAQRILNEDLNIRSLPPSGEGKRSTLELTHVEPGSLPSRYGFSSGDRILSVNGIPMTSLASATNWYKQNSTLPSYHVVYERLGAQKAMTIYNKSN